MKPKAVKYAEAVDRNLLCLAGKMHDAEKGPFLAGVTLDQLRTKTGIRKEDHKHDGLLQTYIDLHTNQAKKSAVNAKKKAEKAEKTVTDKELIEALENAPPEAFTKSPPPKKGKKGKRPLNA